MDFGKNVFPFLLERDLGIFGYTTVNDYYWQDCGRPELLLWTNWDVLKRWNWPYLPKGLDDHGSWYGTNRNIENNVKIQAPISLGDDVQIKQGTTVYLTSIADKGIIGENCEISSSLIWEHVTIGNNVKIKRSIISDNVTIGDNCTIDEDTIIASGRTIPANTHIKKGEVFE